jgi:hypothetical protein
MISASQPIFKASLTPGKDGLPLLTWANHLNRLIEVSKAYVTFWIFSSGPNSQHTHS